MFPRRAEFRRQNTDLPRQNLHRASSDTHSRRLSLLLIVVLVGLLAGTFLTGEVSFGRPQASEQAQQSAVPQAAATSTTWYFAEGSVGGTFQEFLTLFNPNSSAASVTI